MNVFDPKDIQRAMSFKDFAEMTDEELAGKLVMHRMQIKGQDFYVWSKYDDHAILEQRCMVRCNLIKD